MFKTSCWLRGLLIALCLVSSSAANAQYFARVSLESPLHLALSAGITVVACRYAEAFDPDIPLVRKYIIGGGVALAAGIGKEFLDVSMGKFFDYTDVCFDLAGIGAGLFLHYQIWDRKKIRGRLAFDLSHDQYLATLRITF